MIWERKNWREREGERERERERGSESVFVKEKREKRERERQKSCFCSILDQMNRIIISWEPRNRFHHRCPSVQPQMHFDRPTKFKKKDVSLRVVSMHEKNPIRNELTYFR